jgi:hypothetical protein
LAKTRVTQKKIGLEGLNMLGFPFTSMHVTSKQKRGRKYSGMAVKGLKLLRNINDDH